MVKDVEYIFDLTESEHYLRLYRVNYNGMRVYIQKEPFRHFSGLTGALEAAGFRGDPAAKRLNKWREDMIEEVGKENIYNYVDMTANFGTMLHEALVRIKDNGKIVWAEEKEMSEEIFEVQFKERGITKGHIIKKASYEYQKHVGSLMQFVHERVNEIYAIEVPAIWNSLHIATPIDIVCNCRLTPKGEFQRTTVNIKTSKTITPHHMEQVSCELHMWNETYPDELCQATAIMRTKDWTEGKTPTFDWKYLAAPDANERIVETSKRLALCLEGQSTYFRNPVSKEFKGETIVGEAPEIVFKNIEQGWTQHWIENIKESENDTKPA